MASSGQSQGNSIPQPAHSGNSSTSSSHRKLHTNNDGRNSNSKRPYHQTASVSELAMPSSAHNQQQGIKRPRVRDYIGHRGPSRLPASFGLSSGSPYDSSDNMPLPLVKPRASEHRYVVDRPREAPLKISTPADDFDAPLNLCVKRPSSSSATASSSAASAAHHISNNHHSSSINSSISSSSNNRNNVHKSSSAAAAAAAAAHSSRVESLAQQHERLLALAEAFPKKRGRKPKSLLAPNSVAQMPVIQIPTSMGNDGKGGKKRGRPPLMSPPPNMGFARTDLPNFGLEGLQMISNRLAAAAAAVPSTQLQPGWPTFSPSGQIIFPTARNGNSSNKLSVPTHVRESVSRSGSEGVKPSDSETDDESEASKADEREAINEENLRIPLRYG